MSTVRAAVALLCRDLAVERASREATIAVAPFVVALVVLAGLAFGPSPEVLQATGPGVLWLVVVVAAIPLAGSVAAGEHRDGTWDQLRCLVPPAALLVGKLGFVWLGLLVTWSVTAVVVAALLGGLAATAAVVGGAVLGTLGLAAVLTVFGVLTGGGNRRGGLLAVLLLPAALPALLAGTQTATPGVPAGVWLVLLGAYDAVVIAAAWAVFPALLEE